MQEFYAAFLHQVQQISPFELFAFITGVACVYLNAKENIWGWPIAIVAVTLHMVVYFRAQLYSDLTLQGFYLVLNAYGWYQWLYGGKEKDSLPVSKTKPREWVTLLAAGLALVLGFGYFFDTYTDAELAYYDAFTTGFSLVAMFMMGRKLLENWLVWIVVDVVAIGVYLYKDLYLIALEFLVFLVICIFGYIGWKKSLAAQKVEANV